jgi:gamma-butyrobetaine dioxygenase
MKTRAYREAEAGGLAVVRLADEWGATPEALRAEAERAPYAFAARVLGVEPLLVERQTIRPVDGGRSFASTRADTPLHTDSQMFLGVPAALQIVVCVRAAPRGGESVFLDGLALAAAFARTAPELSAALHDVDRAQRFYFGEVRGPTVARRGGHWTWTLSPATNRAPDDPAGRALDAAIARARQAHEIVVPLRPGEAFVASNHRMLHGRRSFEGERELVRLLAWLEEPLAVPPDVAARARAIVPPLGPAAALRLRTVLRFLRGVPPSRLAAEAAIDEATLYAWRDAFALEGARGLL